MCGRSFGWDYPPSGMDGDMRDDDPAQCPISNACPMNDARECERWGQCYWEEQEQSELDETAEMYDYLI